MTLVKKAGTDSGNSYPEDRVYSFRFQDHPSYNSGHPARTVNGLGGNPSGLGGSGDHLPSQLLEGGNNAGTLSSSVAIPSCHLRQGLTTTEPGQHSISKLPELPGMRRGGCWACGLVGAYILWLVWWAGTALKAFGKESGERKWSLVRSLLTPTLDSDKLKKEFARMCLTAIRSSSGKGGT